VKYSVYYGLKAKWAYSVDKWLINHTRSSKIRKILEKLKQYG